MGEGEEKVDCCRCWSDGCAVCVATNDWDDGQLRPWRWCCAQRAWMRVTCSNGRSQRLLAVVLFPLWLFVLVLGLVHDLFAAAIVAMIATALAVLLCASATVTGIACAPILLCMVAVEHRDHTSDDHTGPPMTAHSAV